jgi:hypothetical protein
MMMMMMMMMMMNMSRRDPNETWKSRNEKSMFAKRNRIMDPGPTYRSHISLGE